MGSAAVCAKTRPKRTANINNEYEIFSKNLDKYLKSVRNKNLLLNIDKNGKNPKTIRIENLVNDCDSKNEISDFKDNLVFQPKSDKKKNQERENFYSFLKTGKLPSSNLNGSLNLNNLLQISLELLSADQQTKIKNINHFNLLDCVTFPRILNDVNLIENVQGIETTEISEKTNFRIIYNKNMQDIMNNLFFPEEFKMQQRNTMNFTMNSISFRDLPLPLTQLNVTTSNINGGQHIMEISNLNNINFNTQPNEDFFLKGRASNFTNFNRKIKNYFLETDKISNCNNDTSSNNLGSVNIKYKDSFASKTLKQLYDKVFFRNSFKTIDNQPRNSRLYSNPINVSFRKSISPDMGKFKKTSIFSKNKSFVNNYPKTALYTIEDCNYDDYNTSKIYKNFSANPNIRTKNSEIRNIKPNDILARKLYYSLEVRAKILEKKEKEQELMMRTLSDLEEEYNQLQEEINPIFNIKNAIDDSEYNNEMDESRRNIKYSNMNERKNKYKSNKNSKKEPLYEINIKDLIRETINERLMSENNKEKNSEKSKIIKCKNLNINNININIQTNTEGNYSTLYKKKPKNNSNEYVKENFNINASSEFINSIETLTNINNTNYDKKNLTKMNSLKKIDKLTNLKTNFTKRSLIGYSDKSLKNKYSNLSSSKKIDTSKAQKIRKENNKGLDLNNNHKAKNNIKTKGSIVNKNRNPTESKLKINNCQNIFSNVVIESPIITNDDKSIGDLLNLNKTKSNNYLVNLNIPTLNLPERNSYNNINERKSLNTTNNNIESINNVNIENDYRNMDIDKKRAFSLKKYASNSLISESNSFNESELVSSFDSKDLANLQDESAENNINLKLNLSIKDKISNNNCFTQGNSQNHGNEKWNKSKYIFFNDNINNGNFDMKVNQNDVNLVEKKESNLIVQKRNKMIDSIPKFMISNLFFSFMQVKNHLNLPIYMSIGKIIKTKQKKIIYTI